METEITKRVGAGWRNWKKCSGVLCDRRMPVKLQGKVYKTVIRPAMLYGAETWATTKRQEKRIEVTEMRMLRWMCGVTRKDKINNEHIRGTTRVAQAFKKSRREDWTGTGMWWGEMANTYSFITVFLLHFYIASSGMPNLRKNPFSTDFYRLLQSTDQNNIYGRIYGFRDRGILREKNRFLDESTDFFVLSPATKPPPPRL